MNSDRYVERLQSWSAAKSSTWDRLWNNESIGRIALAVCPAPDRIARLKDDGEFALADAGKKPENWTPEWESSLRDLLFELAASTEVPGELFLALRVPRFVHGQSQGTSDIFGARVEAQPDGNFYVYPLDPDPAAIEAMEPGPLEKSVYWGAVEWIRYARAATQGACEFRMPVMTDPFDTANYLLGTTTLLDWVTTHPDTVHSLLDKITNVTSRLIAALQEAAGGVIHSHHFGCVRGGFDLCSEMRSIVSQSVYEEFEAPYLRRLGKELGSYGIHSCGSWERTIPSALGDPNLRMMHGQIKENDLAELCRRAAGRKTLSIGPSINLHERYMWSDTEAYLRHILETAPDSQPLEIALSESDLPLWKLLYREIRGCEFQY